MPTSGIIVGDHARLYIDGEPIGYATNCTVSFSRETRQTLHKDNYTGSTGWATSSAGTASGAFSAESFFSQDGYSGSHLNPFDIFDLLDNSMQVTVQFRIPPSIDVAGDKYWEFDALVTAQEVSAGTNADATFSLSGTVLGQPSVITVT